MISLKNKPLTLFIAGPILGLGIILGVGYALYAIVKSLLSLNEAGLAVFVLAPLFMVFLLQVIAYLTLCFFLLRAMYKWSTIGIILSAFVSPVAFLAIVSLIPVQTDLFLDFSSPLGIGVLIFFLLASFTLLVVAYNDVRYRKKALFRYD